MSSQQVETGGETSCHFNEYLIRKWQPHASADDSDLSTSVTFRSFSTERVLLRRRSSRLARSSTFGSYIIMMSTLLALWWSLIDDIMYLFNSTCNWKSNASCTHKRSKKTEDLTKIVTYIQKTVLWRHKRRHNHIMRTSNEIISNVHSIAVS